METESIIDTESRDAFVAANAPNIATAPTAKPEFHIDSEDSANWLLRKLAQNDSEIARIEAQADTMIRILQSDTDSLLGRFGSELEAFGREECERRYRGKRKSLPLFHGTLAFRTVNPKLTVASHDDAITTARAICPGAVTEEVVVKLDRDRFLDHAGAHFEVTGELLPGVERTEAREAFRIDFPKAGKKPEPEEVP